MKDVVIILVMLASVYGLTTLLAPGERRRFGFVSGAEFFVIGALLGPMGLSLLSQSFVRDVAPAIVAACAWLTFIHGLRLRRSKAAAIPRARLFSALAQPTVAAGLMLGALLGTGLAVLLGVSTVVAVLWAIAGASASQGALSWVKSTGPVDEARELTLRTVTGTGGIVTLAATAGLPLLGASDTSTLLLIAGASAGALLFAGLVALLFGRGDFDTDFAWVALVGFLMLGTGMALQLNMPIVSVGVLMGLGIGWFSPHADALDTMVAKTERPAMVLLLLLLGTQLTLSQQVFVVALALVALRFVANALSGALVMLRQGLGMGTGVLGGGEAATLILAAAALVRPSSETAVLLAAHGLSLVLGDLLGAPLLKRWLSKERT